MEKFTVRQNSIGMFAITFFYAVVLVGLSITVNLEGWSVIFEVMAFLMVFNFLSFVSYIIANRINMFFYVWGLVVSLGLAVISFYIWIALTYWADSNAFLACTLFLSVLFGWVIYLYVKSKMYPENPEGGKTGANFAALGALVGAGFQGSSENGILLIASTTASFIFSLIAIANLISLFRRQWIIDAKIQRS